MVFQRKIQRALMLALLLLLPGVANAQQNVRAFYAKGQTFVVWEDTGATPVTYQIYRSPNAIVNIAQGTLAGRIFEQEWRGERLDEASQTLRGAGIHETWLIPTNNAGGTYRLLPNECLFVYTPRANVAEYFSVVKTGNVVVNAVNRTAAAVAQTYDPVNDPVQCHPQFVGVSPEGYPYSVWGMWSDGRDDHTDNRPDFPITANFAKNGAPHVFVVYAPPGGPGAGPYPAVFALHGGGGEFDIFRPGNLPNIGLGITEGLLIAPSDNLVFQWELQVGAKTTGWLGYVSNFDPFTSAVRTDPPSGSTIINYTMRRMLWILDWLQNQSPYTIDAKRVSMLGHSAGGRGTSILTRWKPERFSSATLFTPALINDDLQPNPLRGSFAVNLETNLTDRNGLPLLVHDVFRWSVPLSDTERDFPVTRMYSGRLDPLAIWDVTRVTEYLACNDSAQGFHLYWDMRDHGVPEWSTNSVAIPGMDVGQWVVPNVTERGTAEYQHRYQANISYPAFFNDDQDANLPGRQPEIGDGMPNVGAPWGTWAGYGDWEVGTITDTPTFWASTLYLIGLSGVAIDNAPFIAAKMDVAIRKPQDFRPETGRKLAWRLWHIPTGNTLQTGIVTTGTDYLVTIPGLIIRRDPDRSRLEVQKLPRITGHIRLEDAVDPTQPIRFEFRPVGMGTPVTRIVTLVPDANPSDGTYMIDDVLPGTYVMHIKGAKWLAKNVTVSTNSGDVSRINATLLAGDANNDNSADVLDLDLLIQSFDKCEGDAGFLTGADLNCDGCADVLDLDLLLRNFDLQGEL